MKSNEDTPVLSATKMLPDTTFWLYRLKVYADIRHGSRVRRRQQYRVVESDQFSMLLVALSSVPLKN